MQTRLAVIFDRTVTASVVIMTLAFGYAGGFWVAYPLMAISILSAIGLVVRGHPLRIAGDWGSWTFWSAFGLLVVAFAATGDLEHAFNFLMFLFFAPLSTALARLAAPRNGFVVAVLANVGCAIGLLIACYQIFVLHTGRAASFGSDPIWSAQAGIIVAFFGLLGLMTSNRIWRILFVAGPSLMVIAVVLSASRGPILAIPLLVAVFIFLGTRRWCITLAICAAVTAAVALGVALLWPEGLQRLASVGLVAADLLGQGQPAESSAGDRLLMYQAGIAAFGDSPLVGHGWRQLMPAIAPYVPGGLSTFKSIHHHLHSDGLDFAVSGGILGLVSYLLVLIAPLLAVISSPRDSQYKFRLVASVGLGLGYAVFGLTYLTFGYEYHTTLYICLAAIVVGFCRDKPPILGGQPTV